MKTWRRSRTALPLGLAVVLAPFAGPGRARTEPASASPPAFAVRGTLPWHNFLSGPTAWDEADYVRYLDRLQALGLNYIAFHCYTGGAERYGPYVEPLLRIEYRDVVPEAGLDTSLTARWGYRPLPLSEFAFDTGKLFPRPRGVDAFGARSAVLARDKEDRYRRAQDLMRRVITHAHRRGIRVGLGFEFGILPPELPSVVPPGALIRGALLPDPTHPAAIEILRRTLDDLVRAYPDLDDVWLWLHEHTMHVGTPTLSGAFRDALNRDRALFAGAGESAVFTGVWSLAYIREAQTYLARRAPRLRLALSGWGGGTQLPDILRGLDRALPTNIVFTCLNPDQGLAPQPDVLAEIAARREVWAIPWLEGDASLWHLQPRVGLLQDQVRRARSQRLHGVLAIHWRTEETRANLDAFAQAATRPDAAPDVDGFYRSDATAQYGPAAAALLAPLLARWDRDAALAAASPEYFAYDPTWGRLKPEVRGQIAADADALAELSDRMASRPHRRNLDWLLANLQFTLLLDEVGRALEPAYRLKEQSLTRPPGADQAAAIQAARAALDQAPLEALFRTFARRVRSRGELGELSSLNQRVWLQYRELDRFLAERGAER